MPCDLLGMPWAAVGTLLLTLGGAEAALEMAQFAQSGTLAVVSVLTAVARAKGPVLLVTPAVVQP